MESEIIPPDLTLIVTEERHGNGERYFRYIADARRQDLGLSYEPFESQSFRGDPQQKVEDLFKSIAHKPSGRPAKWLANRGASLFAELLPPELRRKLWEIQGSVKTVQIVSNEVWVPWELMTLQNPSARPKDYRFLVEAFSVTRWLPKTSRIMSLPLQQIAVVAPTKSGLPKAQEELQRILSLAGRNRAVQEIQPTYGAVEHALGSGQYDGFHFAGHGVASSASSYDWSLHLDDDQLTPPDLNGEAGGLGSRQPLVFLNACHSGRGAASLTGLGGLASAFVGAGAGAFLGTLWEIRDRQALRFAEEFYGQMLSGEELGEAVRKARLAVRDEFPHDTGWLAYTAFAHPLARCSQAPVRQETAPAVEPPRVEPPPVVVLKPPAPEEPPAPESPPEPESQPEPSPAEERIHEKTGMVFVYVPGGEFLLGVEDHPFSKPVRWIRLSPFWIGKYPVTNQEYARFLEASSGHPEPAFWNDSRFNQLRQPAVGVTWEDAHAFCLWAGLELPSEAQWEAAARGTDQRAYPWGKEVPTERHANFDRPNGGTAPVGSCPAGAGPYGTFDQAGNIWEWCADPWDSSAYRKREDGQWDPIAKGHPAVRTLRGGSWNNPATDLHAAYRDRGTAKSRFNNQGFRCLWRPA
jgi:formylglycine-generating enzyme required for sulfatase activity